MRVEEEGEETALLLSAVPAWRRGRVEQYFSISFLPLEMTGPNFVVSLSLSRCIPLHDRANETGCRGITSFEKREGRERGSDWPLFYECPLLLELHLFF